MENTVSETPTTCPIMENVTKSHDKPRAPFTNVENPLVFLENTIG